MRAKRRLTRWEKAAIVDCLAHCEAAGTELDFMGGLTDVQKDNLATTIANALQKVSEMGWALSPAAWEDSVCLVVGEDGIAREWQGE